MEVPGRKYDEPCRRTESPDHYDDDDSDDDDDDEADQDGGGQGWGGAGLQRREMITQPTLVHQDDDDYDDYGDHDDYVYQDDDHDDYDDDDDDDDCHLDSWREGHRRQRLSPPLQHILTTHVH